MSDVKARAREALTGITRGNWEVRNRGEQPDPTVTAASVHSGHRSILFSKDGFSYGYADISDAKFIAAAPQLIADLLSLVEAQETRIEAARKLAERGATMRPWTDSDGPSCDTVSGFNELGEDILRVLEGGE